ncbi:class C sortase [Sharpea azabuensis]|uniref:class C sortase n=1 Tax=Sharpea azabuensis TaxID=322505 RepID=UPI0019338D2A|nr:class C sortase [Sharpea azabuensis]
MVLFIIIRLIQQKDEEALYKKTLDVTGTGIMGYVEIPKINVSLPIYHGDDQAILQIAIGHIPGTSLPVGGKGTHSVLSGHRGLPSARLFTDIDQLKKGDIFMLQVMDNTLTYKVDQISVVLPSDMSKMQIDPNQDYCTLMTCTPYGVNTHRLLVRGHRISRKSIRVARNLTRADYVIWDLSWGLICLILVIILIRMVKQRRKTMKS